MPLPHLRCFALLLAALCTVVACAQTSAPAVGAASAPVMQLPPDQVAFRTANATVNPQQRSAALQRFLHDYPKSRRVDTARRILLEILAEQQPQDVRRIHDLAKAMIDTATKSSRPNQENSIAYILAEAPPNGVDLQSAETWARDAVDKTTLPDFARQMSDPSGDTTPLTPQQQAEHDANVKLAWSATQAANLQTLADVYLHQGKLEDAAQAVAAAQNLNPAQGATFVTLGQIEHARHHDDKALEALETADVYGGMTPSALALMTTLYAAQHGGDRSGLEAEIDRRYHALYQPTAPVKHASTSGSTVFVALYTGSACEPCAAADLAMDGVLQNYSREEVVALAFDQHIPDPDPLANDATVARGTYDGIRFTPTFRINGLEGPMVFGRRPDQPKAYKTLAAALDKERGTPGTGTLHLTASLTSAHTVVTSAEFHITNTEALHKLLAASSAAKAGAATTSAMPDGAVAKAPKLVLNFALVQREVRYSGENGIRFHSMVVRDLAKPTADAFPIALTGPTEASFTFDPAAVSAKLSKYLADFTQHNNSFGAPHFLTTDTTLPLDDLAVAAWVEDLTSHRVIAAAYTSLHGGTPTQQAAR